MSNNDSPLKGLSAEASISSNLIFCTSVGIPLFILFCLIRGRYRNIYAPNVLNSKRNVSSMVPDGKLDWIKTVMQMQDEELLPWVGLDGFVLIQTIKLFIGILLMTGIPALLLLVPTYYYNSPSSEGWFVKMTIFKVTHPAALWLTLAYQYYAMFAIFYGLYTFYRNLAVYRQAYLRCPSCAVSQVSMRRLAMSVGNIESAKKLIDIQTRSVLLTNVSSKYTKSSLIQMFREMGIDDVSSIVIVQNRDSVVKILEKRNEAITKLEAGFRTLYLNLCQYVAAQRGCSVNTLLSKIKKEARIPLSMRTNMLKDLFNGNLLSEFRPKTTLEDGVEMDYLTFYYEKLLRHDDELIEASKRFASDNDRYILDFDPAESPLFIEDTESIASDHQQYTQNDGLVSIRQLFKFRANTKDYGLTLWGTSMAIIVIFGSTNSATIASQTLLSPRPFSMVALKAPQADDIIWSNLYKPSADRLVHRLFIQVIYVTINLLFTSVNVYITSFLNSKSIEQLFPFLSHLIKVYPKLGGILSGVLAPLVYNLILLLAPYVLFALSHYQGSLSRSEVQRSLMQKYIWLLYIQTFVLAVLGLAVQLVIEKLVHGDFGDIIDKILLHLPEYSAFFTNVIIQRAAVSLLLLLIKPASYFFLLLVKTVWHNDIRKRVEFLGPDSVFLGIMYPEYILFSFMITLAYLPLSPLITIAGFLFYLIAYLVFRYHFIFSYSIPHEGGGGSWMYMPTPIIVACITGQIFSIIEFSFLKAPAQALLTFPLIIFSIGCIVFLNRTFKRRSSYSALGPETCHKAQNIVDVMSNRQEGTVYHIAQEAEEEIHPTLNHSSPSPFAANLISTQVTEGNSIQTVEERNYETVPYNFHISMRKNSVEVDAENYVESLATGNPYCNPIMFDRITTLLLPAPFFHVLRNALDHYKSP